MSNTVLTIINGSIAKFCDTYYKNMENEGTHYVGNGWIVDVTNTSVDAVCAREYHDGIHKIHVQICDERMITELFVDGERIFSKTKKCDYSGDGEIGLSGGNIDQRYVYFRSDDFNNFLKKHEILKIHKLNYIESKEYYTFKDLAKNDYIYTDGTMTVREGNLDQIGCSFQNVTVILKERMHYGYGYPAYATRVLYTNIHDLSVLEEMIPKLRKYHLKDGKEE
jgi:hypothetical protein